MEMSAEVFGVVIMQLFSTGISKLYLAGEHKQLCRRVSPSPEQEPKSAPRCLYDNDSWVRKLEIPCSQLPISCLSYILT